LRADNEADEFRFQDTLTIEEWKAEQQLFEHKRTVPVYPLVPAAEQ